MARLCRPPADTSVKVTPGGATTLTGAAVTSGLGGAIPSPSWPKLFDPHAYGIDWVVLASGTTEGLSLLAATPPVCVTITMAAMLEHASAPAAMSRRVPGLPQKGRGVSRRNDSRRTVLDLRHRSRHLTYVPGFRGGVLRGGAALRLLA